jgi:hypothetical protein
MFHHTGHKQLGCSVSEEYIVFSFSVVFSFSFLKKLKKLVLEVSKHLSSSKTRKYNHVILFSI